MLRGMGGQAFSRATQFVNTLAVVPLLLGSWGLTVYGEWVSLTAIATIVSFSNFGLANAASTEIIREAAAARFEEAQRVFATTLGALSLLVVPIVGLTYVATRSIPIGPLLNVTHIGADGIILIAVAMTCQVWLNTLKGLFFGVTFSTGKYGVPNLVSGIFRLTEVAALLLVVGLFRQPPHVAAATIASVAAADLIAQAVVAKRSAPWLSLRGINLHLASLRRLMGPSLGVALLHLGVNFVGVQGPRIMLGAVAGPAAVGVFSVYATAYRAIDQVNTLLMSVVQIEFSRSSGSGDVESTRRLLASTGQIAIASYLFLAVCILVGGPVVFGQWTDGRVPFDYGIASLFLVSTLFMQTSKTPLTYLTGSNQLLLPVLAIIASGILGVGVGSLLAVSSGAAGMAAGQVVSEILTVVVVLWFVSRSIDVSPIGLLVDQYRLVAGYRRLAAPVGTVLNRLRSAIS